VRELGHGRVQVAPLRSFRFPSDAIGTKKNEMIAPPSAEGPLGLEPPSSRAQPSSLYPGRFLFAATARASFGPRVDRLGRLLFAGDPIADAAIDALGSYDRRTAHALIDAGARGGARAVSEAPEAVRAYFDALYTLPLWADRARADRGGRLLFRTSMLTGLVLGAKSLLLGYAAPGGNKPLVLAGGLLERAPQRLNETARYVRGVALPGGIFSGGEGFVITAKVRLMHAQLRRSLLTDARWKIQEWGVPANQHDMAATILLFSSELLSGLQALGVAIDAEERDDYMHLWRVAGHLMGVDPEILPANAGDAAELTAMIAATQGEPDADSRALAQALLESPSRAAVTEDERKNALRQIILFRVAARELLGDQMADALGVQPTPFRRAFPLFKRLIASGERVQKMVGDGQAMKAGQTYWDNIRDLGLARYGFGFELPQL
jgi:hypothetical protein